MVVTIRAIDRVLRDRSFSAPFKKQ